MKLLYRTAEWHALAKLRIHTDSSLTLLDDLTTEFGRLLRKFRDVTCSTFSTFELPRETAARNRREIHTANKRTGNDTNTSANTLIQDPGPATLLGLATSSSLAAHNPSPAQAENLPAGTGKYAFKLGLYSSVYDIALGHPRGSGSGRKPMALNLHTIKLHFLGDYVRHIRTFGTTNSYSTQLVCACFCLH
jgi:hypothetical protein